MRHVSLERGRIGCGTVLVMYFWLKPLREFLKLLKLMKKVDARMDYCLRTRLEHGIIEILLIVLFSCLPTHSCGQD